MNLNRGGPSGRGNQSFYRAPHDGGFQPDGFRGTKMPGMFSARTAFHRPLNERGGGQYGGHGIMIPAEPTPLEGYGPRPSRFSSNPSRAAFHSGPNFGGQPPAQQPQVTPDTSQHPMAYSRGSMTRPYSRGHKMNYPVGGSGPLNHAPNSAFYVPLQSQHPLSVTPSWNTPQPPPRTSPGYPANQSTYNQVQVPAVHQQQMSHHPMGFFYLNNEALEQPEPQYSYEAPPVFEPVQEEQARQAQQQLMPNMALVNMHKASVPYCPPGTTVYIYVESNYGSFIEAGTITTVYFGPNCKKYNSPSPGYIPQPAPSEAPIIFYPKSPSPIQSLEPPLEHTFYVPPVKISPSIAEPMAYLENRRDRELLNDYSKIREAEREMEKLAKLSRSDMPDIVVGTSNASSLSNEPPCLKEIVPDQSDSCPPSVDPVELPTSHAKNPDEKVPDQSFDSSYSPPNEAKEQRGQSWRSSKPAQDMKRMGAKFDNEGDATSVKGGRPRCVHRDHRVSHTGFRQGPRDSAFESSQPSKTEEQNSSPQPEVEFNFAEMKRLAAESCREALAKMTPIIKNVYLEDPSVSSMTPEEVEDLRSSLNNVNAHYIPKEELQGMLRPAGPQVVEEVKLIPIPNPISSFRQGFGEYSEIMEELRKQGFTEPTPIQCQMWPCIMKGIDVVGIAQTGSGKTLAFLLPALIHIERQLTPREHRKSPTVLILEPTRELAQQVDKEVKKYSYKNIRSVCLYGGAARQEQIDALAKQTEIVIATPGRLTDLVVNESLNLREVSFLVLDEADEMLNQGFEPQINKALMRVREDRQTILTSATWPESVRRIAKNYTKNPLMVVVGTMDLRATKSVKQNFVFIDDEDQKFEWVKEFLQKNVGPSQKAIVFVGKRAMADHLSSELVFSNIITQCIHGSLCQNDREQAIEDMKDGSAQVLIASDVASRGIDIANVNFVVNYAFPNTVEQYVHRIGRSGRAGCVGESHTIISRRDGSLAQELIDVLKHAGQEVPQELEDMAERFKNRRPYGGGRGRGGPRGGRNRDDGGFSFGDQRGGGFQGRNQFGGGGDRFQDRRDGGGWSFGGQ